MIGLYIALGVVVLFLIVTYAVYLFTFYSPHKGQNNPYNFPPDEVYQKWLPQLTEGVDIACSIPYETVSIKSADGLTLMGKYYHCKDNAPIELCVHGYRGVPLRDFGRGIQDAMKEGYNVLAIEQRGADRSSGHTVTFGTKEKYDVLLWVDYLIERFGKDTKIALAGVSMGATTVLMAGSMNLPSNVKGVFADSPFSSPKTVIKNTIKKMGLPGFAYGLAWCAAAIWGGFNLNEDDVLTSIVNCKVPVLIIHGDADDICDVAMSRQIAKANPNIQYVEIPNAGHVLGYFEDYEGYQNAVQTFRASIMQD